MSKASKIFSGLAIGVLVITVGGFAALTLSRLTGWSKPDPACFASDKLRVKVGDRVFAFPRGNISHIRALNYEKGKDVSLLKHPEKVCQKFTDEAISVENGELYNNRKTCLPTGQCDSFLKFTLQEKPLTNSSKSYEEFCPPFENHNSFDDITIKRNGGLCVYAKQYEDLYILISLNRYLLKNNTSALIEINALYGNIVQFIKNHEITNK